MIENIVVRRAEAEDIDGLADFAARSFRDTFEADNDVRNIDDYLRSSLTATSLRDGFNDASNLFLIAVQEGEDVPVGYATLCTKSHDPSINGQNTIEIERIYADKRVIGCGVGAALMRACLNVAEDLGCEAIWLGVWEKNERAIRFYERWKFTPVGVRQFALGSELQDDLVMSRKLK